MSTKVGYRVFHQIHKKNINSTMKKKIRLIFMTFFSRLSCRTIRLKELNLNGTRIILMSDAHSEKDHSDTLLSRNAIYLT